MTAENTGVREALDCASRRKAVLRLCVKALRALETDWGVLTDWEHGEFPGAKALAAAEALVDETGD